MKKELKRGLRKKGIYELYMKRALDLYLVIFLLLIVWPIFLVLAILIRFRLGTPILFKQARPGLDGTIFTLYKFRSMSDVRDKKGNLLPDEARLTRFGKMLRKTSLDELPEFFNILKGDMSLVGPRPLLVSYLPLYNKRQSHRHDVRPGLTGLAQVSGRNAISWEEKFELDITYIKKITLVLDLKIMAKTVWKVLKRESITNGTEATTSAFMGSKNK